LRLSGDGDLGIGRLFEGCGNVQNITRAGVGDRVGTDMLGAETVSRRAHC
jgi:hypothetical protein